MEIFMDQNQVYILPTNEKPLFIEFEDGVITYDLSGGNIEIFPYFLQALWKYKYRPLLKVVRPPDNWIGRRKINDP